MKSLTKVLLFMGLGLMPILAIAATETSPAPVGELVQAGPASYGMCSEPTPALVGLDLEIGPQDCGVDNGGLSDSAAPASMEKKPGGCKACPAQPWCACTYQGHPRISCDPCCYQTYTGEICTS